MPKYAKLLGRLKDNGSIPKGEFSPTSYQLFKSLFDTDVLVIQKASRGQKVIVQNIEAFSRFLEKRYPSGLEAAINGADNRQDAVAIYCDSKRSRKSTREIVSIKRGTSEKKHSLTLNGIPLPVGEWCARAGVAALRLDDGGILEIDGSVAFVENINVFYDFEKLCHNHSYLIYTEGRISDRILKSLKITGLVTHYGDYDPVGCDEYLRIKKYFANTTFYCPENIDYLFRYSQKELITKSNKILARLRSSDDPLVKKLVSLMDKHNKGLEHEILLKPNV